MLAKELTIPMEEHGVFCRMIRWATNIYLFWWLPHFLVPGSFLSPPGAAVGAAGRLLREMCRRTRPQPRPVAAPSRSGAGPWRDEATRLLLFAAGHLRVLTWAATPHQPRGVRLPRHLLLKDFTQTRRKEKLVLMVRSHQLHFPGKVPFGQGETSSWKCSEKWMQVNIGMNLTKLGLNPILSLLNEVKLNQGPFDSETVLES